MTQWDALTRILDLPFAEPFMIVEEAFAILAWQGGHLPEELKPRTLGDVAVRSGMSIEAVLGRLKSIADTARAIEVTAEGLRLELQETAAPLLLDVRQPWEFAAAAIPGSVLLARADFEPLLAAIKASDRPVVTICQHGIRSYSAALFLSEKGIRNVRSLSGGVEGWMTLGFAVDKAVSQS